jgi:hypothetical protein
MNEKQMTLLAKAKAYSPTRRYYKGEPSSEEIELALAWANDEITLSQVSYALTGKPKGTAVYTRLALALKKAYKQENNERINPM